MKGKMKFVESLHIGERVMSHKSVPAPAIFPSNKTVVVAIEIKSASIEVCFATNTCFDVTKQHYFVTNEHCFVTNKVCFVTNKVCFATNKVCFVTNKVCFVTNKVYFVTKQSLLRDKQSLLRDKQTLLRGKATFVSDEEALLRRKTIHKHQLLNRRRTYRCHKTHPSSCDFHAPKRLPDRGNSRHGGVVIE